MACVCRRTGGPTTLVTTQEKFHDIDLAHPNIYPIYELLEHMEGPVLLNQSCRISVTHDNSRISKRSLYKGPELVVQKKPETQNQTNDSLPQIFASKTVDTRADCWPEQWLDFFLILSFIFYCLLRCRLQRCKVDWEGSENKWTWGV